MNNKMIIAAGILNGLFAIFHLFFWSMFNWPESLALSGPHNPWLMSVFNIVTTYTLFMFAGLCIFLHKDILNTTMGRAVGLSIAGFWILRTLLGFVYCDIRVLETQALSFMFLAISTLLLIPLYRQRRIG